MVNGMGKSSFLRCFQFSMPFDIPGEPIEREKEGFSGIIIVKDRGFFKYIFPLSLTEVRGVFALLYAPETFAWEKTPLQLEVQ